MRAALASALALLAASPALAGGFSPVPVAPAPMAPVMPVVVPTVSSDWGGFYVGGQIGTIDGAVTASDGIQELDFFTFSGPFFGVHAGYMFDFGRIVAGAELDYDMVGADLELNPLIADGDPLTGYGTLDSVTRLKARLGFDAGRFLPYVTAGIARASLSYDEPELDALIDDSVDGRFVGIGAAFKVRENILVGIEALRHDFDGPDTTAIGPEATFETAADTISLRGSFRF